MTDSRIVLAEAFASGVLGLVLEFWFSRLPNRSHVVVPTTEDMKVWFVDKSEEYDNTCR